MWQWTQQGLLKTGAEVMITEVEARVEGVHCQGRREHIF